MADSVKVVGLQDLGNSIDLLTQKVQRQMIRKAGNAGVEVFRREIRAKAPVRQDERPMGSKKRMPGYLKRHIGRQSKATSDSYTVSTGPMKSAFYGKFIELGTSHQAAQPFMRPAFDSKNKEAERVFADTLKQQIDGALK